MNKVDEKSRTIKTHFVFLALLALMLMSFFSSTYAQEAYAVWNDGKLVFYYDNDKSSRSGATYALNQRIGTDWLTGAATYSVPAWKGVASRVTQVVFDPSFAGAHPTTCYYWFNGFTSLKYINGLENLNTSSVTSMESMFRDCSTLISLDLSSFETWNVTSMERMFSGCANLEAISVTEDDDYWNLTNVKESYKMFDGCNKLGGKSRRSVLLWLHKVLGDDLNLDLTYANTGDNSLLSSPEEKFKCTVNFYVDGTLVDSKKYEMCTTITVPFDVATEYPTTADGDVFDGWYTDIDRTKKYDFHYGVVEDLNLYAKYSQCVITVKFDGNLTVDATHQFKTTMSDQYFTCNVSQSLKKNEFLYQQYVKQGSGEIWINMTLMKLLGWSTTPTGEIAYRDGEEVTFSESQTSPVTLYAKWGNATTDIDNRFAIWKMNNGTEDNFEITSALQETGSEPTIPVPSSSPTREDYTFVGWNSNEQASTGQTSSFGQFTSDEMTFYAIWKPNTYNITYVPQEDEASMPVSYPATYTYDLNLSLSSVEPTCPGYTFRGWYSDADCTDGNEMLEIPAGTSGDVTVYAKWEEREYPIVWRYNYEGAAEPYATTFVKYGDDIIGPVQDPDKAPVGKEFDFWGEKEDAAAEGPSGNGNHYGQLGANEESKIFYAQWKAATYTLTFVYNGANGNLTTKSIDKAYDSDFTTEKNSITPTRTGYSFDGWVDEGGYSVGDDKKMPPYDLTLYTSWKPNTYTVKYDVNGGSPAISNQTLTYDETANLTAVPSNFKKTNYKFKGWTDDPNGTTVKYEDGAEVKNLATGATGNTEITLYAVWAAQYTVKFNGNNASGSMPNQIFTIGEEQELNSNAYTLTGKHFGGWAKTSGGTADYYDGQLITEPLTTTPGATVTLFAVWGNNDYVITFKDGTNTTTQNFGSDESIPLRTNTFTKAGNKFVGWTRTSGGTTVEYTDGKVVSFSSSTTLFAVWEPEYTITFIVDDGTSVNPIKYITSECPVMLPIPTKTGSDLDGWYESPTYTGTKLTELPTDYSGNKTLYAKWISEQFDITYKGVDGCTWSGNTDNPNPASYDVTSSSITLETPEKEGYEFLGWTGTDLTTPTQTVKIFTGSTGDREYTANWTPITYMIVYNNGGATNCTGSMDPTTFTIETGVTLTKNAYTSDDYFWYQWYIEDNNLNDIFFADEATLTADEVKTLISLCDDYYKEVTLYSDWHNYYTINYVLNGGALATDVENPTKYNELDSFTFNNPTKNGYDFDGWYGNESFTGDRVTGIAQNSIGNKTFYAKWNLAIYYYYYHITESWGGSNGYTIESDFTLNDPEERPYYTFAGWYDNDKFTGDPVTGITKGSTGEKHFYAKWNPIEFAITYNNCPEGLTNTNPATYTVESGDITLVAPEESERYKFLGWYSDEACTNKVTGVAIANGSHEPKTFYAKWIEKHTVSLPAGLEFVGTDIPTDHKFDYGSTVSFKVSDDYVLFDDITTDPAVTINQTDGVYSFALPDSPVEVKADVRKTVALAVSIDDWTYGNAPETPSVTKDGNPIGNSDVTITYTDSENNPVTPTNTTSAGTYTVTAAYAGSTTEAPAEASYQFDIDERKLIITIDDKSKLEGDPDPELTYQVEGLSDADKNTPLSEIFDGNLDCSHEVTPGEYTIVIGSLLLKDKYQPNYDLTFREGTFTIKAAQKVTFHTEYGTVQEEMKVAKGEPFSKPDETKMTADSYTFSGDWYTDENFAEDKKWNFATDVTDEDLDLYAKWSLTKYSITFNTDDGNSIEPIIYTVESGTIILPSAIKTGYTFEGWYDNPEYAGEVITSIAAKSTHANVTLYSKFTINAYNVSFNVEGVVSTISVNYNEKAVYQGENPTKDEDDRNIYTFAGWESDVEGVTLDSPIISDVTFTAQFTATEKTEITSNLDKEKESVNIYALHKVIVVENGQTDIYVYDLLGGLVARREASYTDSERIEVPNIGVYVVKCGDVVRRVLVK